MRSRNACGICRKTSMRSSGALDHAGNALMHSSNPHEICRHRIDALDRCKWPVHALLQGAPDSFRALPTGVEASLERMHPVRPIDACVLRRHRRQLGNAVARAVSRARPSPPMTIPSVTLTHREQRSTFRRPPGAAVAGQRVAPVSSHARVGVVGPRGAWRRALQLLAAIVCCDAPLRRIPQGMHRRAAACVAGPADASPA